MAALINGFVLIGTLLLCARLWRNALYRQYRAFFAFLLFSALQTALVAVAGLSSQLYYKVYVISEPVAWLLNACVVLELYELVLKDYKGLYTVGRWCLVAAVVLALFGSAVTLLLPSQVTRQGHLIAYYYMAERAVYFSLVVFLFTILALLTRYPIVLSRNAILHSVVFTTYFFCNTVAFALLSTRGFGAIHLVTLLIEFVSLASVGAWLALLNPAGENRPSILRPTWLPGRAEDLAGQLNSLNRALMRAVRI